MRTLFGLQYLRAFAAIAVLSFHAAGRVGSYFHAGEAGVDLFFLLSGFLMVSITKADTKPITFLTDRIRRIVPAYWAATSLMLAGTVVGLFPNQVLTVAHVFTSYFFIPSWSPSAPDRIWPLVVPGWTLNYEIMFYVVFAATLPIRSQIVQLLTITFLFSIMILCGCLFKPISAIGVFYRNPILLEFVAGGWLGYIWQRPGAWHSLLGYRTAILAVVICIVLSVPELEIDRVFLFGLPSCLLLASILAIERRAKIGKLPIFLFLGNASYSIYLWHPLAISVAVALGSRLGLHPTTTFLLAVSGGLMAGALGYVTIERPVIQYYRKRRYVERLPLAAGP